MMITRYLLSFMLLFSLLGSSLAQERAILFEEIQQRPVTEQGEWVIGGKSLIANQSSRIRESDSLVVGNLAVLEYYVDDSKAYITQMEAQPIKAADIIDGPYVMWRDEKTADVFTMVEGKIKKQTIENIEAAKVVSDLTPLIKQIQIDPNSPTPPKSEWDAPKRLLAISDLEGNYLNALRFLQNNNVIDEEGNWDWGDGHLVLVGDLVDRGQSVTEVMWLLKRLEREAATAGGHVHYILGNHEAMVMKGDIRYVHPKYHFVTQRIGIPYDQLFGINSEIGRWWRSKNAVERVGDLLFVHGGYSPMLDDANLDLDELNKRIRAGLAPSVPTGLTAATNPTEHMHGPFWYRGYFEKHGAEWGGQATPQQIRQNLERHSAKHVVIGHTVVDHVGPIDESGLVIGIDVKWADSKKCEGLLQEDGKLYRLTMTGERIEILAKTLK